MTRVARIALLSFACPLLILAGSAPSSATPAHMVVTIGHHYGHEPPVLTSADLSVVTPEYRSLTVTNLTPLRGDRAGLEMFVLVDNCSSCEAGTKFQELSRFIASQPPATAVGVAYITAGKLKIAELPTLDRARAVKALNAPAGSAPASPYDALKELIATWQVGASRRAVVMVTNGINPLAKAKAVDPSAEAAIAAAQQAGVTLFAVYHPGADYTATDSGKIYDGQVQLAHVAHDTGGEAYFIGFGPMPSIAPYLADISDHLANQYLLEFLAEPGDGADALREVTVKSGIPDLELMAPERAWIPAAKH